MASTAIIGLGAMGTGLARNIVGAGIALRGYDKSDRARQAFTDIGGVAADSAAEAVRGCDLLVLMVVDGRQAEEVLFGDGAAEALEPKSTIVLCSTVAPSEVRALAYRLSKLGHALLDAPVSGGQVGAHAGTLTVMASGPQNAFDRAAPLLEAISRKVYRLGEEAGIGATYKVVHQLAAGVHLVAAAELLALGKKVGCDPETLFDIVSSSSGQSWMLGDRGPRMMEERPAVTSTVDIFVKDLGLVLQTGRENAAVLPLSSAAHQMMLAASGLGLGREDDSAVIRVFELLMGIKVGASR